jgi:putative transposase
VILLEKAFKYRIYPNKKQQELLQKTFGCCRYVYNYFLDKKITEYKENKKSLSFYDTSKMLTQLKKEKEWLREVDAHSLQFSLKILDEMYQRFFKNYNGFPKFKKKKNYNSYSTKNNSSSLRNKLSIEFENKHIKLPKLGFVKVRDKQIPQGRILNATISQEPNGHYYCSLCCTDIEFPQYSKTNKNVGIDLGIVDFAILSDGIKIKNPRFYEKSEKKLAKLQRELSRKTIGGSNWNKARIKVANLQKHISNQRKDFLQKLTTNLVKQYDIICIEDLDVQSMKETDSSVRNKHVFDVSWSEFRRMLTYKSTWYGKTLSVIDRYFPSSQICHCCGVNGGKKSVEIRYWICSNCGSKLDRDNNASINILNEGLRNLSV